MAQRLGIFSTAVCFPGGHTGARCLTWLKAQEFAVAAFPQVTETRMGWVARAAGSETTFLGRDRPIEEEPWNEAMTYLGGEIRPGDMIAICGSLPGWRTALAEPLRQFLHDCGQEAFVALDTYGAPLATLLNCPIDLVKINLQEFRFLLPTGTGEVGLKDLSAIAQEHPNVKRWVVTSGSGPVIALDQDKKPTRLDPPPVEQASAVGCGDVLLAGILHAFATGQVRLAEAVERALPLAAANAASPGIADFEL
jgi:1-phosphofructokinase